MHEKRGVVEGETSASAEKVAADCQKPQCCKAQGQACGTDLMSQMAEKAAAEKRPPQKA